MNPQPFLLSIMIFLFLNSSLAVMKCKTVSHLESCSLIVSLSASHFWGDFSTVKKKERKETSWQNSCVDSGWLLPLPLWPKISEEFAHPLKRLWPRGQIKAALQASAHSWFPSHFPEPQIDNKMLCSHYSAIKDFKQLCCLQISLIDNMTQTDWAAQLNNKQHKGMKRCDFSVVSQRKLFGGGDGGNCPASSLNIMPTCLWQHEPLSACETLPNIETPSDK